MNLTIPLALQLVIDDVGWINGCDGSNINQPFRTGIGRKHSIEDYEAIIELGKRLGIKPVIAMVLSEWDRKNILKELPNATYMGNDWDNSKNVDDSLQNIVELLNNNQEYYEFAMHGLGHEYWKNGKLDRAEFYQLNGEMRPYNEVKKHIEYFFEIMNQNGMESKVRTFVPPAFCYAYGDDGMTEILKDFGFLYISTIFNRMVKYKKLPNPLYGIEYGIVNIDRGVDDLKWDNTGAVTSKQLNGPVYGIHWPHILDFDPKNNMKSVEKWVECLKSQEQNQNIILAKDIKECATQLIVKENIRITNNSKLAIDLKNFDNISVNDYFYIKCSREIAEYSNSKVEFVKKIGKNNLYKIGIFESADIIWKG